MNQESRIKNQERANVILSVARRAKLKDLIAAILTSFLFLAFSTPVLAEIDINSYQFLCSQPEGVSSQCSLRFSGKECLSNVSDLIAEGCDCIDYGTPEDCERAKAGVVQSLPSPETEALPSLYDPLADKTPQGVIGGLIQTALGVVGSLALVIFVYGGIMWMLSAGNEEKALKGSKAMLWAGIGLIVIFASYILLTFVFKVVTAS